MKLDMGEPIRERVFEDAINEKHQNMKSEMTKELSLDTDKKSPQWNIPCGAARDIEVLMSKMSLVTSQQSPRQRALVRLVRGALTRADRRQLQELAETAAQKSRPEFVRHLGRLLDRDAERAKDDKFNGDASKRTGDHQATTPAAEPVIVQTREERRDKPKRRDLIEGLKDENDLCPRSPMRPQHHRSNNFPYQNTSRNHHSGGIMSAVAYSDAIGPTPQYHNHLYQTQSLGTPASRPPLVVESSDVLPAVETTFDDLDSMVNLSEGDLQILMSLAVDLCPKMSTDYEMFPESISEINSTQFDSNISKRVDHRVPTDSSNIIEELFPSSSAALDTWGCGGGSGGGYYHDDSTSGCSSLSPNSFSPRANPESPDSGRVVPDNVAPNMSPPGQFFDDRLPAMSDYNRRVNAYTMKPGDCLPGDRSPGSSGYSSTGIPSPSDYPPADDHTREDFDTKVQIASNDYFCSLDSDFDSDYLLPEFENVFESPSAALYVPANSIATSQRLSPYAPNLGATTANISALPDVPCPIAEFETSSDVGNEGRTTFATLVNAPIVFVPGYAVGEANNPGSLLQPALQAKQPALSSPSVSSLKRLEPKVEHLLRAETGRERLLKLMDKKKKAEAWVNISLQINEVAQPDHDGDTQLMILLANGERGGGSVSSYVLEYVYALVEALKGLPRALSAVNHQGHSAVYLAALHVDCPHRAIVVRYIAETLIELGEALTHTTEGGDLMLHELCKKGDQRYDVLVELLSLKNQAGQPYFDVNQYNINGLTPLHVAVRSHGANNVTSLMTVQLLMAERADIAMPDKTEGHTALHLAILESCAPRLVEALLRGAGQAASRACNALNLRRDSPLHCTASRNDVPVAQQTKVIQLLLRHGAVKSLNAGGKFPIALVAEERRQEIRRVYETRKVNQANVGMM